MKLFNNTPKKEMTHEEIMERMRKNIRSTETMLIGWGFVFFCFILYIFYLVGFINVIMGIVGAMTLLSFVYGSGWVIRKILVKLGVIRDERF